MTAIDLPAELILYIVECLIPSDPPVVFAPGHEITRTLLDLTLVCKLVSKTARQLLIKHCLHLDSGNRLSRLLEQGFLTAIEDQDQHSLPSSISLLLSPFPVEHLNIPPTVYQIDHLSTIISNRLTRLVIDVPLRHLYPDDDTHQLHRILRRAFSRMTALQEFTSVRDELYLSTIDGVQEPAIWSFWPRLQRLALYNVDIDSNYFIEALRRCSNLTHLVLVRPDGLAEEVEPEVAGMDASFLPCLQRLIIVNTGLGFLHTSPFDEEAWERSFVGRLDALRKHRDPEQSDEVTGTIPSYLSLRMPFGRDDEDIEICQEWLAAQAISGRLWGVLDDRQDLLWSDVMKSPVS
ncbi:uncharacterized protein BDV17DRAFT_84180 [Aspergillus undulatus]|uniref:uncharacterized protein n=1 Tax=Aspergillus undulatus TaxID=1810928 RepID=UPI003CCD2AFD